MSDILELLAPAIRRAETGGHESPETARGAAGEYGMYQLMPKTAQHYNEKVKDNTDLLFDPKINESIAKSFMSDLLQKYDGDPWKAAYAYQQGETRANKAFATGEYSDKGKSYADKVVDDMSPDKVRQLNQILNGGAGINITFPNVEMEDAPDIDNPAKASP